MLYREVIAVSSAIRTKHINTLCGQNVEIFNIEPGFKWLKRNNILETICSDTVIQFFISSLDKILRVRLAVHISSRTVHTGGAP